MTERRIPQGFIDEMETKLKENEHKPHWEGMTLSDLYILLRKEEDELLDALAKTEGLSPEETQVQLQEAQREAADVANFAMMIWDNLESMKPSLPDSFEGVEYRDICRVQWGHRAMGANDPVVFETRDGERHCFNGAEAQEAQEWWKKKIEESNRRSPSSN